jgi:transcriptional regulator with XRE-family HTH domain
MTSYVFDIGEKARKASRFIAHVRAELQKALIAEKAARKITQQQIASQIGVNRSVINRQLMGTENLTLRSVADLAWALGWDIAFELKKPPQRGNQRQDSIEPAGATAAAFDSAFAHLPAHAMDVAATGPKAINDNDYYRKPAIAALVPL